MMDDIIDLELEKVEQIIAKIEADPEDEDVRRPTLDDVKYSTWYGGKHYYAKIGKIDIVDRDNNQKWNTLNEAKEAAKWYIETYYK